VNSRPLTFVSDEADGTRPLTPSLFLIGRNSSYQSSDMADTDSDMGLSHKNLNEREIVRQERLELFWSIWSKEYLRNLPSIVNKFQKRGDVGVGSLVLIREDNTPRMKWPRGVITRVLPSRDGVVRTVELKTVKGKLIRPLQRLHDLEVNSCEHSGSTDVPLSTDQNQKYVGGVTDIVDQNRDSVLDTSEDNAVTPMDEHIVPVVTRSGRVVKPTQRFDL
jgi:hypothetical protein